MPSEIQFALPLVHGLHARPASAVQEAASGFESGIRLVNRRNGRTANAKSVLSLVGADVRCGDDCVLIVDGSDAAAAGAAMERFLRDVLPGCDEPLPSPDTECTDGLLVPRAVREHADVILRGTPVHPGIAFAKVALMDGFRLPEGACEAGAPDREKARILDALAASDADLARKAERASGATERGILSAHRAILQDPEFRGFILEQVAIEGVSAGRAVLEAERYFGGILRASESAVLRERALDIRDVARGLLMAMYGGGLEAVLTGPSVCVAESMAPSELLALDRSMVRAIVLADGGTTSHTAILARAFGIPLVVGVAEAPGRLLNGQNVIVDARRGLVLPDPPESVSRWYALEAGRDEERGRRLAAEAGGQALTTDGRRVEVAANAATPEEAESAFASGADGIGLFRTEMLFMDRDAPPSEGEQYEAYARVVRAAGGRPVIFRTLDIGGDKPLPYLDLPEEENPFLGYRAIRFYAEHDALVRAQMRAILRTAAFGPVRVMFPMVCCVEEVRDLRRRLDAVRSELESEGAEHGPVEVGIMIETPAAALSVDLLAAEADFFSIGTNDLAQYTLAVDRGNGRVAGLYGTLHPAVLRLLKGAVDAAHACGRWIGLCGEMGGQESLAPLLVGLGLDEVSVAPPAVAEMKAAVRRLDAADCRALLEEAVGRSDRAGVEAALAEFSARRAAAPILDASIVRLDSGAASREEVIKELVDLLYLDGRLADPDAVEEAVWQREDVYSTGVGFGFAIPHCKSGHVLSNSVGVLRLANPVEWNSLDGEPVRIALMLAIRETGEAGQDDTHLRMLARLARRIMHEDFRERLLSGTDVPALVSFIEEALAEGA